MRTLQIVGLMSFILVYSYLISSESNAESVTYTIQASDYQISPVENGYVVIEMDDFGTVTTPGKPQLPAKTFMIALPPGATVRDVQIFGNPPLQVQGKYNIMPAKPVIRGDISEYSIDVQSAQLEWQINHDATYGKDLFYPESVGSYLGQGQWRKYTYASIRFYPFQYNPKSRRLLYYPSCTVTINYTLPTPESSEWQTVQKMLHDDVLDDIISQWLINFEEAQIRYQPKDMDVLSKTTNTQYDYVIIIEDDNIRSAVAPLKTWKEKIGHSVNVVTLDSIYSAFSGRDNAERIWNFLHNNYSIEHWGIRYVLLVGYSDILPFRFLFPSDKAWAYASDFYYAKLTENWDVDGDNRWGEFTDDNLNVTPDVLVGRIPHNDATVIGNICNSIVTFEKDISAWKYQALLAMGIMDFNASGKTDCAVLGEYLKSNVFDPHAWSYTTLYEKGGLDPSSYTCDLPLSETNFGASCGYQTQGLINAVAHGNPSVMAGHVWAKDINKDGICNYSKDKNVNEMTYNVYSGINTITQNFWSAVVFLCGCSTGPPCEIKSGNITSSLQNITTPKDNLGRRYIVNGAPAAIASSAGSNYCQNWSKPADGHQQSFNYYFYDHLIAKDEKVGDAFFGAHLDYATKHHLERGIRVFNLFGDPSLTVKGIDDRPGGTDVVIHDGWYQHYSADNSDDGDMYVAVITTPLQAQGEIKIYKSSDHGSSWILWNTHTHRSGFCDVEVIVGEWGSGEFVDERLLLFTAGADGTVQVHRYPLAGGAYESAILASEGGSAAFWGLSAARDRNPRAYNLYVTYSMLDPSTLKNQTKVCCSYNNGITWENWQTYNDYYLSSIDGSVNDNAYLVAKMNNSTKDIAIKRSTDGGGSWGSWVSLTASDGSYDHGVSEPVVAASTDPGAPTVWVAYPYYKTGDPDKGDIRYAYSTDAGSNWTTDLNLSVDEAYEGTFHMKGYKAGASRWMNMAYMYDPSSKPQVIWRWTSGTVPKNWSAPRIVNDFKAELVTDLPPRVLYSPGAPATGSGVVYGGKDKLYFSAPWLTRHYAEYQREHFSVTTSSHKDSATIQFIIPRDEHVTVMIRDAVGKLVSTLLNEQLTAGHHCITWDGLTQAGYPVPRGIYLCTVKTSRSSSTKPIVLKPDGGKQIIHKTAASNWVETGDLEDAFIVSSLLSTDEATLYASAVVSVDETRNEGVVFRSENGGETWERMGGLDGCWSLSCVFQHSYGSLLAGGLRLEGDEAQGVIYRSEDGGEFWEPVLIFPDGVVTDLMQTDYTHPYAATGWNGLIFKSEDGGREWFPVAEFGENVHIYSIMQALNGAFYAALELPEGVGLIMRSEDGQEWIPEEGLEGVSAVYDIIGVQDRLYAAVRGEDMGWVYECDLDGAPGWFQTVELPDTDIRAVHCLAQGPQDEIYAGIEMPLGPSYTRVFVMLPEGEYWEEFGGTIDLANTVNSLIVFTTDMLYAGTGFVYGNVYKCDLETAISVGETLPGILPQTFELAQNYPNPFNPTTDIRYEIPDSRAPVHTTLKIHNLLGQEVRTLVDEVKEPGYYIATWNGRNRFGNDVASGIYFYKLIAGDFTATRRMLLLK